MVSTSDLLLLIPEILMLTFASLILVVDTFSNDPHRRLTYYLSQLALVLTAACVVMYCPEQTSYAFVIVLSAMA